jgi:hypothetical protein
MSEEGHPMSNQYPPTGPGEPQWNPQSGPPGDTPPPPSYGDYQGGPSEQGYGPPPPYQPPGAPGGGGPERKNSPLAIVSLVTGIIGVVPCCWGLPVLSLAAIVTGFIAKKQIAESSGQIVGRGMAVAGLVLGILGIAAGIAWWALVLSGAIDTSFYYDPP